MTLKVLAVASGGGHWEQLLIVSDSFSEHEVHFATTIAGLAEKSGIERVHLLHDCNRRQPLATLRSCLDVLRVVLAIKPDVVVSTGAAPGLLALAFGKLRGARTIWIDSIANSEQLSMSGNLARHVADLHLTQWEHLAAQGRPAFMGSVL